MIDNPNPFAPAAGSRRDDALARPAAAASTPPVRALNGAPPLLQSPARRRRSVDDPGASTHLHDFAYHTIAFPVSSAGGDAPAMRGHRQGVPTPPGGPPGGVPPATGMRGTPPRPPDVVARRVCWAPSTARRPPGGFYRLDFEMALVTR